MEVVNTRCAGLDVHKKVIVVCGLTPEVADEATGQPRPQLARFGTMTEDLVALLDVEDLEVDVFPCPKGGERFRHRDSEAFVQRGECERVAAREKGAFEAPLDVTEEGDAIRHTAPRCEPS